MISNLLARGIFQEFDVLLHSRVELDGLIVARGADEASAEKGVVPVENDGRLMKLGLIEWSQPDLLVSEFAKKVPSNVIVSTVLRDEVERVAV